MLQPVVGPEQVGQLSVFTAADRDLIGVLDRCLDLELVSDARAPRVGRGVEHLRDMAWQVMRWWPLLALTSTSRAHLVSCVPLVAANRLANPSTQSPVVH